MNGTHEGVSFDVDTLAEAIRTACPDIEFAYLLGSSRDGSVPPSGDLDLAVAAGPAGEAGPWEMAEQISSALPRELKHVRLDLGFLDHAEPVYRFEALKGRLLFRRDEERWLDFFSLTCREYEETMVHYRRQWNYRMDARQSPLSDSGEHDGVVS